MASAPTKTSLDRYRSALSLQAAAPLDPDTERELAAAWRQGDKQAGQRLVEASLPFVIRVAREYRCWGVPLEDLIQQGNVGLLKAAAKYDPDRNCRLITYAVYWVRAEIREYVVRTYRIVRLGTTRTERRAMRAYRRLGVTNVEELAEESGMPLGRAEKLWPLLLQSDMSLDVQYEDRSPAIDRLADGTQNPEEMTSQARELQGVRRALEEALQRLSERERRIVEERMLNDEPRTLEQLGQEMGVSKERVRQLEERVRHKLRDSLSSFAP